MDKRLRPRYYKNKKNLNRQKKVNTKKNKKAINKLVNKRSKKIQKGGLFGSSKKHSCISCIKYGSCSKKMKYRAFGNIKLSSKKCKKYSKIWKEMSTLNLRQYGSDENLIRAIKLYKKNRPDKTLKGFINNGIISTSIRKSPSQSILEYIKIKDKYEKRKVSLKIASLLGY